jgi:hypothetical protein
MANDRYNGWSNYATWRVNLEMIDGMDAEDIGIDNKFDLADYLKEYCTDILESETQHKGTSVPLALSYALAFLSDVNWQEIAEHMLENA